LGTTAASAYFPDRTRNYGVTSQDRTHVLAINYVYELPKLGQQLGSKALGAILDDWTLSGVTSYTSGTPFTPSLNWNGTAPEVTGSEEAAVVNVVGDPYLPVAQRAFGRNFRTEMFTAPVPCSATNQTVACFGNAGVNIMRGPGWSNWDVTFAKQIPLGLGEGRALRFRAEFYNIWNHAEFNAYDTAARFNASAPYALSAPNFGAYVSTRAPRQISMSLRLQF
jgi:hypothetical protein